MSDINEMEVGREMDALIAEKVIGIKPSSKYGWFGYHPRANAECDEWQEIEGVQRYSTDISAAWKVFTHWGWQGTVGFSGDEWFCEIDYGFDENGVMRNAHSSGCYSAPEAICKAALLAVEDKV